MNLGIIITCHLDVTGGQKKSSIVSVVIFIEYKDNYGMHQHMICLQEQ